MQPPTQDPLLGTLIGKYTVTREIGRGGFGVVYEVVQQTIGHRAAAKLLSPALATDPKHLKYVERFIDEARAVNLINHPGVIKIFDLGELPDHTQYILMEYLDGETLQARIDKYQSEGRRMSPRKIFQLVSQLAGVLSQAHDRSVIHRDLKPENVFLIGDPDVEGKERCKLLDFGLARFLDSPERRTSAGMTLGTPIYMAPEQCMGLDTVDGRADVYSLGILLYQLLAGTPPFVGELGAVMRAHCAAAPPPLALRASNISVKAADFVMSLLIKDGLVRMPMRQAERLMTELLDSGELAKEEYQGGVSVPSVGGGAPTAMLTVEHQQKQPPIIVAARKHAVLIGAVTAASVFALGVGLLGGRALKSCPPAVKAPVCPTTDCPAPIQCPECPSAAAETNPPDAARPSKTVKRLKRNGKEPPRPVF